MECPKCKGMMMLERFSDFLVVFYAWKCFNCGAMIDRTIASNRRKSLSAREAQTVAVGRLDRYRGIAVLVERTTMVGSLFLISLFRSSSLYKDSRSLLQNALTITATSENS